MKKYCAFVLGLLLTVSVCSCSWGDVPIDEAHFPDEVFRSQISRRDINRDGVLSSKEAANITSLYLYGNVGYAVSSLKGIEYLTALTKLNCTDGELTELDLSHNTVLVELDCSGHNLQQLDLSSNTHLKRVTCSKNHITSLNLSNHPRLTNLDCRGNNLSSLNITGVPALIELDCYSNDLTAIDLTHCPELIDINCSRNSITTLDLSNNKKLLILSCYRNALTELDLSSNTKLTTLDCYGNVLTELDLSNNTALLTLECNYNFLYALDVSHNTGLVDLRCDNNQLLALDLTHNPYIVRVLCYNNYLTSLTLGNNSNLVELLCNDNMIETIDLSGCTSLAAFLCRNNNLSALNLNNCPSLSIVNCAGNNFTTINTINCPKLAILICGESVDAVIDTAVTNRNIEINAENFPDDGLRAGVSLLFDTDGDGYLSPGEIANVETLSWAPDYEGETVSSVKGLEYFVALTGLEFWSAGLENIDLSNFPRLTSLALPNSKLTTLDVSCCKQLATLNVSGNMLSELDVSGLRRLSTLECGNNRITTLNLNDTPSLWILTCDNNNIADLAVSGHNLLWNISCSSNRLTALNADDCPRLWALLCDDNELASLTIRNCSRIQTLLCSQNHLKALDFSTNPNLDSLYCFSNDITSINVSNTTLTDLSCTNNPITELNAKNCLYLKELWCYNTPLYSLDISGCTALEVLSVYKNRLTRLDIPENSALKTLNCWDNLLQTLDVRNCTGLLGLFCSGNRLADIDISANTWLEELSCSRNQIRTLDLSKNTALTALYCYDNQLRTLDLSNAPALYILACSDNSIMNLDLSSCPNLAALDCSANYLSDLDLTANKALQILFCKYTTLRSLDIRGLESLRSLNLIRGGLTQLDLSTNTALQRLFHEGNSFEGMHIIFTDSRDYPYQTDMRLYAEDLSRISGVQAFDRTGAEIGSVFDAEKGIVNFAAMPVKMTYVYDTGLESADMNITVSIPTRSFIYLPKVQPTVYGVDESVHTPKITSGTDGTPTVTYAAHYVGHASLYDVLNNSQNASFDTAPYIPQEREKQNTQPVAPVTPEQPKSSDTQPVSSSSSGGCNSGLGFLAAILVMPFVRRKRLVFLLVMLLLVCSSAYAENVHASDYTLPIQLEDYAPAGTYTTNFQLTPELRNTIAQIRGISSDRVHSYAEIALSGTWEVQPSDLYNLSRNGEYGGVILPVSSGRISSDYYVLLCTFSNDVKPGEQISVQGFEVSAETRETVYSQEHYYSAASWVTLDDQLNRIEYVPENRRVYLAVSFRPEYINTGILTVIRGAYVEENNPLERLDPDFIKLIADDLGISPDKLQYISRAYIGDPKDPTENMKAYVKSSDMEIILNMPTVSIDEGYEGMFFSYELPDDVWEQVKGKPISDYNIFALNDSESLGAGQVKSSSIITGMISLWEINGGKMDSFGVKEFLIAGVLQASKPFSLYLAKLILMLLLGGCNSGINPSIVPVIILGLIVLKFPRKH